MRASPHVAVLEPFVQWSYTNERARRTFTAMRVRSQPLAQAAGTAQERAVDELVALAQRGDADAFGELYARYQPEILRYLTHRLPDREQAEDLTQQVFVLAWQAVPRYQQRGVPFKAWLYRMAHNQMVDYFRARRQTTDLEGVEIPEEPEAERRVERQETYGELSRALTRLSEDHREVLTLRFLMEKSAREIGQIMHRKEVTVRGLQLRALRALRKEIEAMGGLP